MDTPKWQVNIGFPGEHITGEYGFVLECEREEVVHKIREKMACDECSLFHSSGWNALARKLDAFGGDAWKDNNLFNSADWPIRTCARAGSDGALTMIDDWEME